MLLPFEVTIETESEFSAAHLTKSFNIYIKRQHFDESMS